MDFHEFCGGSFWDQNLTWNTNHPDLTDCFQSTALVWVPCGFLVLVAPLYFFSYLRFVTLPDNPNDSPRPRSKLHLVKEVMTILLIILQTIILINNMIAYSIKLPNHYAVTVVTPAVQIITFGISLFLLIVEKNKRLVTSGIHFIFYLLLLVCGSFSITSIIIRFSGVGSTSTRPQDEFQSATFSIYFVLVFVQFVLFCFADVAHYDSIVPVKLSGDRKPCPEMQASFLSRITYWWMNGLVITGYKKTLEESDLWLLNSRDSTEQNSLALQKNWAQEVAKCEKLNEKIKSQYHDQSPVLNTSFMPDERTSLLPGNHLPHVRIIDDSLMSQKNLTLAKPSLYKALARTFGKSVLISHLINVLCDLLIMVGPQLQSLLINFIEGSSSSPSSSQPPIQVWKGYLYAFLFFINSVVYSIFFQQVLFIGTRAGMGVGASVTSLIYKKALTMNSESRKSATVGEIVNLMSVDAKRLQDATVYLWLIWSCPLQIFLCMFFLWRILGPSIFAGVGVMFLFLPINAVVANIQRKLQLVQMTKKDERIKLLNEVLNGIKVIKFYAWEMSFEEKVNAVRNVELSTLKKYAYLNAFVTLTWSSAPFIVTIATFATYVLTGGVLDANKAFTALSLFNILRFPITMLPMMVSYLIMAVVSVTRIGKFLQCHDLKEDNVQRMPSEDAITIENGTFSWFKESINSGQDDINDEDENIPVLKNINLTIKKGTLAAVVGQVGSGKSSLVSAILGDMEKHEGRVNVDGPVAYVSQMAWIQNATVRDNILFGQPFDEAKYNRIIEACALNHDLKILSAGDKTEIGDKGINLSGGQKQRVSLARSLYQDCDVYLLDDPLSAVDSHVAKHIFNNVIGRGGLLKNKTRLLVTHGITWLPDCDVIVVMNEEGRVSECGAYEDLLSHNLVFAQFIRDFLFEHGEDDEEEEDVERIDLDGDNDDGSHDSLTGSPLKQPLGKRDRNLLLQKVISIISEGEDDTQSISSATPLVVQSAAAFVGSPVNPLRRQFSVPNPAVQRSRTSSTSSRSGSRSHPMRGISLSEKPNQKRRKRPTLISESEAPAKDNTIDRLVQEELSETGSVKFSVYMSFVKSLGFLLTSTFFGFFIFSQVSSLLSNFWLSTWTNDPLIRNASYYVNTSEFANTQAKYLGGYGGFGLLQAVFILIFALLGAEMNVRSSRKLHADLLSNILKSPMSFFDTTPIGRILNRFSKDVETVDNIIMSIIESWLTDLFNIVATVIVVGYTTPIFLLVVIPVFFIYYFVQRFYVPTTRQLKRLESTSRSPIYVHFSESIAGASVIRAFARQREFITKSQELVDNNLTAYFANISSNRWLSFFLDLMGGVIILCAALLAVLGRDTLSPSIVGLSISYALQLTESLSWVVRMSTQLEINIISVERIKEYSETPSEADWHVGKVDPPNNWPQNGGVRFEKFGLRYRPGLDLVLKNVNFDIRPGEKVGIVGRTGAGKSSTTLALFRLVESSEGRIIIDDFDISLLALYKLRSSLTVLPQDPVLFSGSLRMNLDPTGKHQDEAIWRALEQANLKNYVTSLPHQLDFECTEGGENMSMGQRQLMCLGRTLLHKTSILILDEATAAVDLETDKVIQETIRTQFSDCTILTIAHRINTILNCDRVIVMDEGSVIEFDSPQILLENKKSRFFSLAKDAGIVS